MTKLGSTLAAFVIAIGSAAAGDFGNVVQVSQDFICTIATMPCAPDRDDPDITVSLSHYSELKSGLDVCAEKIQSSDLLLGEWEQVSIAINQEYQSALTQADPLVTSSPIDLEGIFLPSGVNIRAFTEQSAVLQGELEQLQMTIDEQIVQVEAVLRERGLDAL